VRARSLLRRTGIVLAGLLAVAAIGAGGYFAGEALFGDDGAAPSAAAPRIVLRKPHPQAAADIGFPAFATKNTTRVGGADPVADAAGVALAADPSSASAPAAVSLVPPDWRDAIAAAALTAPPIGAPILIGGADGLPPASADALRALAPAGSPATGGDQVFAIGPVAAPQGPRTKALAARDPATLAADLARLRARLAGGKPAHVVVASSTDPAYAMPAAAWAARSGDPVLFAGDHGPPPVATLRALHRYAGVPVYVLGPASAVSDRAFSLIHKVAPTAKRVAGADPVTNAIDFARYVDGGFGWNINDPGHGLVIASVARPLDAGAAAALSASGAPGPLLVTASATMVPPALRGYLLDLKPGYEADPTRAVYNHVWLIGDAATISVGFQAEVDDLVNLVKVRSGAR
jgi:hypothetical protein